MKQSGRYNPVAVSRRGVRIGIRWLAMVAALLGAVQSAQALPLFNRQTGQNCMACHAGGQFPELTPYGRLFKMTGYTLGQRTAVPLSAMAVVSDSKVANTSKSLSPSTDFFKQSDVILATASVFAGGKITDNIGAFVQVTYNPYAVQNSDGSYSGHSNADNMDLRWADRFVDAQRDLIVGVSLNNNPSVSDPWNTSPAWMQYVPVPSPGSSQFIDGTTPYPGYSSGGNIAGLTTYAFLDRTWYGELGFYGTARGPLSFMTAGIAPRTTLRGLNPYWRLAWNREWGANSLMIGSGGMYARVYQDPSDPTTIDRFLDWSVDAQYQYLLDPHAVTAQLVFATNRHGYPNAQGGQVPAFVDASGNALLPSNFKDRSHLLRAKLSYVYQARYGGSISLFSLGGTTNTANISSGFDPGTMTITADPNATAPSLPVNGNLTGNPGARGGTLEAFWMPVQNIRVGAQYTIYTRYNGASTNYDGFGRNASDNNSLFLYMWMSY
ncbi:MAG: cytochrome C [Paucibacter sp.]|nr:cytochrome C [Roseateles sp.]